MISWEQVVKQNERDVKKLFYSMLLQQKTIQNDRESLENTYQRFLNTEKSYKSGNAPRLDVLQSHVTYQNMKRDVEKEELDFNSQMKQFASILGFDSETEIELDGSLEIDVVDFDQQNPCPVHESQFRSKTSGKTTGISFSTDEGIES